VTISSGPIHQPHPSGAIFDALMTFLPRSELQVVWADRALTTITTVTGPTAFADGLQHTIYVQSAGPDRSVVTVQVNGRGTFRGVRGRNPQTLDVALAVVVQAVTMLGPPAPP
jgi:hypothetical protein